MSEVNEVMEVVETAMEDGVEIDVTSIESTGSAFGKFGKFVVVTGLVAAAGFGLKKLVDKIPAIQEIREAKAARLLEKDGKYVVFPADEVEEVRDASELTEDDSEE